jgi:hypothetical protein
MEHQTRAPQNSKTVDDVLRMPFKIKKNWHKNTIKQVQEATARHEQKIAAAQNFAAGQCPAWNNAAKTAATIQRKTTHKPIENKPQEREAARAFNTGANPAWNAEAQKATTKVNERRLAIRSERT